MALKTSPCARPVSLSCSKYSHHRHARNHAFLFQNHVPSSYQPHLTSHLISNPPSQPCFSGEEVGIKFPHLIFPPHLIPWEVIPQCARAAAHSRNPDVVHSSGTVRFFPDAHWPQLAPKRCKARATAMVPPAEGKKPCLQLLSKYQTIIDSVTSLKGWITLDISSRSFPSPTCLHRTKPAKLCVMQEQTWPHF